MMIEILPKEDEQDKGMDIIVHCPLPDQHNPL